MTDNNNNKMYIKQNVFDKRNNIIIILKNEQYI